MSNKNKLGITEGEYETTEGGILSGVNVDGKQIAVFQSENNINESRLFADAGTTANKCGLLPSELLKQRNKAIKILDAILSDLNPSFDEINVSAYKAGKELIQSIEKE